MSSKFVPNKRWMRQTAKILESKLSYALTNNIRSILLADLAKHRKIRGDHDLPDRFYYKK